MVPPKTAAQSHEKKRMLRKLSELLTQTERYAGDINKVCGHTKEVDAIRRRIQRLRERFKNVLEVKKPKSGGDDEDGGLVY